MSVKIRLQRHGAKQRPYYFIVVANSTSKRDGKFIEKLGTYNPLTVPATIQINRERALHWINQGAQPTHTANRILSFKGVLYLKHLMRGVSLGLFDKENALEKFETWNSNHEKLVAEREISHKKDKAASKLKPIIKKVSEPVAAPIAATTVAEPENTSIEVASESVSENISEPPPDESTDASTEPNES